MDRSKLNIKKKLFKLTAKPKQQRKKFPAKKTYSFITDPQNTASWSSRLWVDSDSMANDVENLVNKNIKHGLGPDDLTELMKKNTLKRANLSQPHRLLTEQNRWIISLRGWFVANRLR